MTSLCGVGGWVGGWEGRGDQGGLNELLLLGFSGGWVSGWVGGVDLQEGEGRLHPTGEVGEHEPVEACGR